jgi:superfamily II DNA or RNA helicase
MHLSPGDHIHVRGARWIVDEVTNFADCTVLSLSANGGQPESQSCRLLLPFDRPVKIERRIRARQMSPRTWLALLQDAVARTRAHGQLRALDTAAITLHAFQLEPALALVNGRASRFLLADEVGLGKTIQAGLMLAELQQRGWCERAIVVTPAGLRQQWADELHKRFRIAAAVVDAVSLRTLSRRLPIDVNPWSLDPVVITSIDFVKQPEVIRALERQVWDVLVVDEAHQATAVSLRYAALKILALRSRHVVLLTATPHGGNEADYRALCDLGKLEPEDRIVLFRRTREQAGLQRTRRVHLLPVRPTPQETKMHHLLSRYAARLWSIGRPESRRDAQLVAMALSKRAFSSATSLAVSLERRLAAPSNTEPPAELPLPFDLDVDSLDAPPEVAGAGFDNRREETAVLKDALEAAREAAKAEAKMAAVLRLLRRVSEPLIIFTEYRDTLEVLQKAIGGARRVVALHGGKTAEERRLAVDGFTKGAADVLLATDAGAEGLNLHARCRLLINLELPWNPMRLEQRIGRIDRLGQRHAVHVFNLIADGTAETTVLASLLQRLERIQASDIEIAASIIARSELPLPRNVTESPSCVDRLDLSNEASQERARVEGARKKVLRRRCNDESHIPVTFLNHKAMANVPAGVPRNGLVWFVQLRTATGTGRIVDEQIIPLGVAETGAWRRRNCRSIAGRAISDATPAIMAFASRFADARARSLEPLIREWAARALRREKFLRDLAASGQNGLVQPGLFDSRALRLRELAELERSGLADASLARARQIEAASAFVVAQRPRLLLLLMVGRC